MLRMLCSTLIIKRFLASKVTSHQKKLMTRGLPKKAAVSGVKDVLVIASGKGGVGKSTVAVNVAVTMANMGLNVGLLDGDIFGPSVPLMMNLHEEPLVNEQNLIIPPVNYGVKCLSMGLLTPKNEAIIWRGPLVMSALQRLLRGAVWGPLDILIVDTPPGTGDVHLSLTQNIPIGGVVLVSTPQAAALEVALRGAQMYKTLGVPLLGLIENMGYVICGNCQTRQEIFKSNTNAFLKQLNTELLVSMPMDSNITECCDQGVPVILKRSQSDYARRFELATKKILQKLHQQDEQTSEK